MSVGVELVAYNSEYLLQAAQVVREILSAPPIDDATSLNDVVSQLQTDSTRDGFGGIIALVRGEAIGLVTWYDITGRELYDRWRPRFTPKERIPMPGGRGAMIAQIGVLPSVRGRGLGSRLLQAALTRIEPLHDWAAVNSHTIAHSALSMFNRNGFEVLPLTGIQSPERICLLKAIRQPVAA